MGTHRYWRLEWFANLSTDWVYPTPAGIAEVELHDSIGGSDRTGSGTATASSNYNNDPIAPNAFDNNTSTIWAAAITTNPAWLKYDFGNGNAYDIKEILLVARNDSYYTQAPATLALSYSDDDANWTTKMVWTGLAIAQGATETLNEESATFIPINQSVARRYWKILFHSNNSQYGSCGELELREVSGGPDVTGSGTASAFYTEGGGSPANAFDNNNATYWGSWPQPGSHHLLRWIAYDFGEGEAKNIVELAWRSRADGYAEENPSALVVLCSDDNTNWYVAWTDILAGNWASWSAGEQRIFSKTAIDYITNIAKPWYAYAQQ